ncbi:hypothetical protein [Coraliomargarita parva]|uniref:hypothetical protein n=1 Tax=Coraliomargarita parva TaxID=3014050 RepID=UPI0022B57B09|nr:hypothetical protein [Coraliomargarita parva]
MKNRIPLSLVGLTLTCCLPAIASADVLAEYTFGDTAATGTYVSSDSSLNSTASDLSAFSGVAFSNTGETGAGIYVRSSDLVTTGAAAITAGDYLSFTLTPEAGQQIELTSFTFYIAASHNANIAQFTGSAFLTDSSDSNIGDGDIVIDRLSPPEGTTSVENSVYWSSVQTITLSGATTITEATEFRFYVYSDGVDVDTGGGDPTPGFYQIVRFDGLTLNGTVSAIPEPATTAILLGLTMLGFTCVRRSKRA